MSVVSCVARHLQGGMLQAIGNDGVGGATDSFMSALMIALTLLVRSVASPSAVFSPFGRVVDCPGGVAARRRVTGSLHDLACVRASCVVVGKVSLLRLVTFDL